jgi:ribosomal protein S17E
MEPFPRDFDPDKLVQYYQKLHKKGLPAKVAQYTTQYRREIGEEGYEDEKEGN